MSDNPFGEPDDSERTMFIPTPGGKRAAAPPPQATAYQPAAVPMAAAASGPETITTGASPLLTAAAGLLALLARLRNTARAPDASDLRERAVNELRRFEQVARGSGVTVAQLRPAHYALCVSLDDVVLSTPWGAEGTWAARSLESIFHQQVRGGEGFFAALRDLTQSPGANLPVLELMYYCLSLGFQGQYRLSPRGPAELDRVRENLYSMITRQRAALEPGLSPQWQGVDAPYRPRGAEVPLWVVATACFALVALLFAYTSISLGTASDGVLDRMANAPPATMPAIARAAPVQPPPPPAEPGALDRLRAFLKPEIDARQVVVVGTEASPVVRITGPGMFASGSAEVEARFTTLLGRIGAALKTEPGPVTVAGYTDNQPPRRTLRYPSNSELSQARAEAAQALLAQSIGDAQRLTADGRGAAEPLAPNSTAEGRERNRRIEITLRRQE